MNKSICIGVSHSGAGRLYIPGDIYGNIFPDVLITRPYRSAAGPCRDRSILRFFDFSYYVPADSYIASSGIG
ncbi:MAG: hypothetical protein ACOX7G_04815 [Candidatus Scatomorpha sp.]